VGRSKSDLIEQGLQLLFAFLSRGQPLIPRMANQVAVFLPHKAHLNGKVVFARNHASAVP
jgi:hypothetical protein